MRRLLPALLAMLGLFVTACGTDATIRVDDTIDGRAVLAAAPDATRNAGTAHLSMHIELSGPGVPEGTVVFGSGRIDFVARRAFLTYDMGPLAEGQSMATIMTTDAMYTGSSMFSEEIGATWLRLRYSTLSKQLGIDIEDLMAGQMGGDPSAMLDQLYGVSDDVEVIGTELIRGIDTTHYHATIDPEDLLEQVDENERDAVEALLRAAGNTTGHDIDVWVDDEGLVRRQVMTMTMGTMSQTLTADFYDYGVDVVIEIPEDDVIDLEDVLDQMGFELPD